MSFTPRLFLSLRQQPISTLIAKRGLEIRFIDAVRSAITHACNAPQRWRLFDGEIRRVLVHVFPYAVLYSIEDGFIYIIAVMHCSREPGYWKTRKK
jgi:hypothetical protein